MKYSYFLQGLILLTGLVLTACGSLEKTINHAGSGFGGTGINLASTETPSSGFGGTGIIGVISDFGSVWVNGVEVDYQENITIESNLHVDDQLKLGQVVILETDPQLNDINHPTTQKIRIHYSLAGEIQQLDKNSIQVNGQWVHYSPETPRDEGLNIKVGEYIAINAIQKSEQQWEASRLNWNPRHTMIDRPDLNIDFSSNAQRILADQRLLLMMQRWKISGAAELVHQRWNPVHRMKPKSRFPLKYQRIRKHRIDRIRMHREQVGASDRIRAKRDTLAPRRPRPNFPMPAQP